MLSNLKQTVKKTLLQNSESRIEKSFRNEFKETMMKWCTQELTPSQKEEVQSFYMKHLGRKIDLAYHTYYYFRNGIFSPLYVPTSIYKAYVIGRLNDMRMKEAYIDKNRYDVLFPQINQPKSIVKCMNGYYYHDNNPISKEDAIHLCSNINNAIIKPSLDSLHGTKVLSVETINGKLENGKKVEQLFDSYGNYFIVQERIKQHERMAALNPTSVNTIRLLTYRRENTIELLYSVVRIGRKDKITDNESSGGLTTKINSDGCLADCLYAPPSEGVLEKTDSGITAKGYLIPSYEKAVAIVKTLHLQLPYFKLVGWDIAIGEDGEPVFIEWNARAELSQTAAGPAFREFTEEILEASRTLPTTQYFIIGQRKFID